jgi:hypothetical protein
MEMASISNNSSIAQEAMELAEKLKNNLTTAHAVLSSNFELSDKKNYIHQLANIHFYGKAKVRASILAAYMIDLVRSQHRVEEVKEMELALMTFTKETYAKKCKRFSNYLWRTYAKQVTIRNLFPLSSLALLLSIFFPYDPLLSFVGSWSRN